MGKRSDSQRFEFHRNVFSDDPLSQWGTGGEQKINSTSPDKTYVSDGDAGAAYRGGLPRSNSFLALQLPPTIPKKNGSVP